MMLGAVVGNRVLRGRSSVLVAVRPIVRNGGSWLSKIERMSSCLDNIDGVVHKLKKARCIIRVSVVL